MTIRTRKLAAVLSATALLGGAGVGIADAAKTTSGTRSSQSAPPGGHRGGMLPGSALTRIATALGVSSADLKAALEANKPARPATDPRAGFAADIADALGVETPAVQTILDANRPTSKPAKGAKPDPTKLIAALADGLNLDTATVTAAFDKLDAAHEADHTARESAMYAALASALDKTAAEVQAAFEANRPAKPTS
jgi:hypothetical protein